MKLLPAKLKAETIAPIAAVPAFAQASEAWQADRDILNQLNAELRAVERQIRERDSETDDQRAQRVAQAIRQGDATGGLTMHALTAEAARLRALIDGRKIIDGDHRAKMAELRCDLSINATAAVKPAHRAAVAAVLAALDVLREAVAAEVAVRRDLIDAGYECLLPAMVLPNNIEPVAGYAVSPWELKLREYAA